MVIPPKYVVNKVVEIIKSNISKALKIKFAFLKKVYLDDRGIWAKGYFVSTVNFGTEKQINLDNINLTEGKKYFKEGHFAAGSIGLKITAIIDFLGRGGKEPSLFRPEKIAKALYGKAGTV